MAKAIEVIVKGLEEKTKRVHPHLKYAPRAFVIEFAGTPKSGKSTAVEAVRHFLSRHQFRVHVLTERAAVCPIPMKGHLFFNTWCAATMLAELLANIETDTDIIIVDRGIVDALVWLQLQQQRGELTKGEAETIESFLLLDRWRSLIDMSVVMSVDASAAMRREVGQRITRIPGSIMNPDVLSAITGSVRTSVRKYKSKFPQILSIDTSKSKGIRQSNAVLANAMVDSLEKFLNPLILVVPREEIANLPMEDGGAFSERAVRSALRCIQKHGRYMLRASAEEDSRVVQIVSAGVLTSNGEVFVFQRKESDPKSRLYGKATIWQGTHIAKMQGRSGRSLLSAALMDRIMRSLFLSREFATDLKGYCWDREEEHSSNHFGVIFRIEIDNENTAIDLRKKEFRKGRGRGHNLVGQFISWGKLRKSSKDLALESWSQSILKSLSDFRGSKGN